VPLRRNSRGARYGFPVAALRVYLPRLLAKGQTVMVIGEKDEYFAAVKIRLPVSRYGAVTSGGSRKSETLRQSAASFRWSDPGCAGSGAVCP